MVRFGIAEEHQLKMRHAPSSGQQSIAAIDRSRRARAIDFRDIELKRLERRPQINQLRPVIEDRMLDLADHAGLDVLELATPCIAERAHGIRVAGQQALACRVPHARPGEVDWPAINKCWFRTAA